MPRRSSFTSSHSTVKSGRQSTEGRRPQRGPESAASTSSTTSSGTLGGSSGSGVSASGPRPFAHERNPAAPSRGFICLEEWDGCSPNAGLMSEGKKSGILIMAGPVGGLRKHPHGRVDQLEDRYLGMVEAPSSNLGTSTIYDFIMNHSSQWWPCCHECNALGRTILLRYFMFELCSFGSSRRSVNSSNLATSFGVTTGPIHRF